jgi:hypothetical protein
MFKRYVFLLSGHASYNQLHIALTTAPISPLNTELFSKHLSNKINFGTI